MNAESAGESSAARDEFLDRLPPEEQLKILRSAERFGPAPTDADWLVARASVDAADRVTAAAQHAEHTIAAAARHTSYVVQPGAAVAVYALALAAVATAAAIIAWAVTASIDDARFRATAPRVAQLIATPGGNAALALLDANGDGLAQSLARCSRWHDTGRTAATCTVWLSGSDASRIPGPAARAARVALELPLWPFATAFGIASAATWTFRKKRPVRGW